MKVLVVHNAYRSSSPSGEDAVVQNEIGLLRANGVEVVLYERHNDAIHDSLPHLLKTGIATSWSRSTYRELRKVITEQRPDVAHFHNIWYLVTPSAYEACYELGVPVVQTLHNFRMFCANGLLLRDGRVCEDCVGKLPWRGLIHGCYQTPVRSLPVVAAEVLHALRGTWQKRVHTFIALTLFARDKFIQCGVPPERLVVKPNSFPGEPPPASAATGYGVFLGRLSHEKGIGVLADAAERTDVAIKIVGDGPLRSLLEARMRSGGLRNVELVGRLNHERCMRLLSGATFLVAPSLCYENFPMAIVEAFACGKPVVTSRLGASAELVEHGRTGLLFQPGDAHELGAAMGWLAANPDASAAMGRTARAVFEEKYAPEANLRALLSVYRELMR